MAINDRVLDLTTDRTRPTVRIDQVEYPLRTSNDLTLDAYKTFERIAPRIGGLVLLDALTPEQGSELSQLLTQAVQLALVAPEAVHAALGDVHRLSIFQVFTQLLTPSLQRATRALQVGPQSAGTKPSLGSNGSTAAVSPAGARTSRSGSSRRH